MLLHAASRRGAYDILHQFADANLRLDETSLPKLTARQDLDGENADEDIRSRSIHRKQIFGSLIAICEQSGLVKATDEGWELASESGLPETAQILQMLMSDNPRWSAECVHAQHSVKADAGPHPLHGLRFWRSADATGSLFQRPIRAASEFSPLYEAHVETDIRSP